MVDMKNVLGGSAIRWIGGAALIAAGAAGGAGAVGLTRPGIEVAPIRPVAIASLAQRDDSLVTVRGKVAEIYGDRFTLADASGKTMVDIGRGDEGAVTAGQDLLVQGRFDNGQLHASFLVDGSGRVRALGPAGRPPHPGRPGRGERRGPGPDGGERGGPPPADCPVPPPGTGPAAAPAPAPAPGQ